MGKSSYHPTSWDGKRMTHYKVSKKTGKAYEKTKHGYKWVGYG